MQLKLDRSGGVTVFCGATEIGQGSDDVLVAVVAEVLGIHPFDVRAVTGDTDLTPVDLGSYSSRVTLMMGNAAIQAAERAREMLAAAVGARLGLPADRLVFADGRVVDREDAGAGVTFQEAVCMAEARFGTLGTTGSYTPPKSAARFKGGGVGPSPAYSYTAAVVEVDVDPETGWITVPRVWIAHDVGCALNPTLVRGQVEGSVYMGLGEALMEEQAFRRLPARLSHALVHKFPSMLEYKSPTSLDMPEIFTDLIEHPDPAGTIRREGSRPGTAPADHAGGGQRRVRRGGRARRSGSDYAGTDPAGVAGKSLGQAGPIRPSGVSRDRVAGATSRRTAVGGRRRAGIERTGTPIDAKGRRGNRGHRRCARMMRLPEFRYRAPRTIEDAAAWLAEDPDTTMLLAGGTDLLPNMKRRQQTPATIIGLRGVRALSDIRNGEGLTVGAAVTLSDVIADPRVRGAYPGLWQAAAQVATPHLRNMGTLGGNLCLDTRCTYYDQNYEWRKSIDFCMKKDGQTCWVATSSPKCLAVSSTDSAPMLHALGAAVTLVSARGQRVLPVSDLYANDGIHYLTKERDEILTSVVLPPSDDWRSSYWKLRRRGAFDFPVAAAAVAARLDGTRVVAARIVLGAVASRPVEASRAAALIRGEVLDDELIAAAAAMASEVAKPMDNTDFELVWRKKMVRSLVSNALHEIRGDDMRAKRHQLARQERLSIRPVDASRPPGLQ